jgi:hypothetical protein
VRLFPTNKEGEAPKDLAFSLFSQTLEQPNALRQGIDLQTTLFTLFSIPLFSDILSS